jgi:hypothetical protein
MTWEETWSDILSGGNPRWKIDDKSAKETALGHIVKHLSTDARKILCPLAGDDRFVHHAWTKGLHVTAIDLVPAAVAAMREHFGPDWTMQNRDDGMVVWKHGSGRATLYQGNVMTILPELKGSFDAVYDKDSFGALEKDMRSDYCARLADYTKEGAVLYVEVKLKDKEHPQRDMGPPFSVDEETLVNNFGNEFVHVAYLGELYPIPTPGTLQTGHILKRNAE